MRPRSKPSPPVIIALVSLPIFIGALDLTVVSAVLPHVIYDLEIPLQTGLDEAAWVVSGYLLAYTIAMTFMGRLSDLLGRRKVYLLALAIFALGSYLVAVADTWPTRLLLRCAYLLGIGRPDSAYVSLLALIAARMIQAFGGGAMVPVGMALAGDLYPPEQRARPLGVIAAVDTAGWVVGHLYGGILTRFFDWRLIFWLNLPICLLAFLAIGLALTGLPPAQKGRMDWVGAALISLCLAALNIGLGLNSNSGSAYTLQSRENWLSQAWPYLTGAVVFLIMFIWQQLRQQRLGAAPLILLALFRQANFTLASLANFLAGVSLFIAIANVPLFINTLVAQTLEQGAWDSGWMLSALTVPMALASFPGGWLAVRYGYRLPAAAGLTVAVAGFLFMTGWQVATPYSQMALHLICAGIGFGLVIAPVAAAMINVAPAPYRGAASALVLISRLVGMSVGISAMTTYGLERANFLSKLWASATNDLAQVAATGMNIAQTVISETFLLAAGVSFLAIIPILFLKSPNHERSVQ